MDEVRRVALEVALEMHKEHGIPLEEAKRTCLSAGLSVARYGIEESLKRIGGAPLVHDVSHELPRLRLLHSFKEEVGDKRKP